MEPGQNTHGRSQRSGTVGPEEFWMRWVTDEQLESSRIATEHSSSGGWYDETSTNFLSGMVLGCPVNPFSL